MSAVQTQQFQERTIDLNGWPVRLTSYRIGTQWVCQADNVSPGALLARFTADTREEAEASAISKATHLLSKTKRHKI